MKDYKRLNHAKWDCKYQVVFIPNRRKKQIYGTLRKCVLVHPQQGGGNMGCPDYHLKACQILKSLS